MGLRSRPDRLAALTFDSALWQGGRQDNAWVLRHPQWWNEMRLTYCDEFAEFVDGLIREGASAD